jgi:hypothetical protein
MAATGARTPQFSQKQPGGAFAYADIRRHPAAVFFVDSTNPNASDTAGFGTNPDLPVATLDYAVGLCTDSVGDVIYLMPGHTETLDAGGDLALDVIGITIRGLGEGALQPVISLETDIGADVDIDAASITIENVNFLAAYVDITAAIDVNADDFTLRNCRFTQDAAGTNNFLICVLDAAAGGSDRITIEFCEAIMVDTSGTHFVSLTGTGDGHIVRNNSLSGDWGTSAIGGAGIVTFIRVTDNFIHNAATDADSGIELHASTTGVVMNNTVSIALGGDATTGIDSDGTFKCQNFVVDTGDRQGVLDPVAT